MRNTFIAELLKLAREDERIFLITGDLGYGVVDEFARELPKQFMNFGINEQSMMGAAAGMAQQGLKPFVYSIGNFPTFRCLEQIRNDVCYMNLDVTIVAVGAGFAYGTAGYSHHLIEDISALSALPNLKIYSPSDELETQLATSLVAKRKGPQYLRLGKGGEGKITGDFDQSIEGVSILPGSSEVAILTVGNILTEGVKISSLKPEFNPTVISCYSLSDLTHFFTSTSFSTIVTLEEHLLRGGFGSLIREICEGSSTAIQRFGIQKIESTYVGDQKYLREAYGLSAQQVLSEIKY
jgi:transketolase